MSVELNRYVEEALRTGQTQDMIVSNLVEAGWSRTSADKALKRFARVDSKGVPVPTARLTAHYLARDLFVYGLQLLTLSCTVLSMLVLGGSLIDDIEAMSVSGYTSHFLQHPYLSALLLITFPLYLLLNRWITQDLARNADKRESAVRTMMIYLILALNSILLMGNAVFLLSRFIEGSLSGWLFIKCALLGLVTVLVFGYYWLQFRQDDRTVRVSGGKHD